jgi:hypothetical protein
VEDGTDKEERSGWTGGLRGKSLILPAGPQPHSIYLFPFTCTHLVKGNSYPEICAQRNGGFHLSRLSRKGRPVSSAPGLKTLEVALEGGYLGRQETANAPRLSRRPLGQRSSEPRDHIVTDRRKEE